MIGQFTKIRYGLQPERIAGLFNQLEVMAADAQREHVMNAPDFVQIDAWEISQLLRSGNDLRIVNHHVGTLFPHG